MTLAVGQRSQKVARLGVMRLGTARLGWYQPWIKVYINGVLAHRARVTGATITDELNQEPNTASFYVSGIVPLAGQSIAIQCGDTDLSHELFGGRILAVNKTYEAEKSANVIYACNAIDPTWLLNRRTVTKKYTNQSATAIAVDLIASFASGVTTVHVATGLPTIDEIVYTNEDLSDALTRLCERFGGYWYMDYASDLHLFLTETTTAVAITTAAPRGMSKVVENTNLSQIATRIIARGGGSNSKNDVDAGGTSIPLEDSTWYGASGTVECGPQRIPYTGVQAGGAGSSTGYLAPPAAIAIVGGTGGSLTASKSYWVAGTYVTGEGETSSGVATQVTLTAGQNEILYSSFAVPADPKVTLKRIYVSDPDGAVSTLKKFTDVAIATTSGLITSAGSGAIPTVNSAGFSSIAAAAGATSLAVDDCAPFLSGGGWAEAPGGQAFLYTGRSVSSGPGSLTGIPASGTGSLIAAVRAGTVTALPHLTGCSGITYAINKGDPVNIVVIVDDATAQTALAALVGGDGIHEMFITDGRWSITEATARANAELSLRKNPLVTVSFQTRDPSMQSGRDVTLTITSPAISGTFKIQRVTLTELGLGGPTGFIFPLRQVEVSSRRYSFEDILRQLKKATT
jgi:hypothetical protein